MARTNGVDKAKLTRAEPEKKALPPKSPEGLSEAEVNQARREILDVIREHEPMPQAKNAKSSSKAKIVKSVVPKTPAPAPKSETSDPVKADQRPDTPEVAVSKPLGPRETTVQKTKVGKKIALFTAAAIISVVVVALVVFGVGLYRYHWNDSLTQKIVQIVPYPAAVVKNSVIRYSDFLHDLAALKQYYDKQAALTPDLVTKPTEEDFRKLIGDKLVKDALLLLEAKAAGITVTDSDVSGEIEKLSRESGGREALEETLKEMYGWTVDDFSKSILRSYLYRQKVQQKLSFDDSLTYNQNAKKRIEEAAQKIKDGAPFDEVAKLYNEDTISGSNGDLGFITEEDVDKTFAEAAFALEEGGVSDIVHTQFGYHIIKLLEKPEVSESDDQTSETEERIHVQHILAQTMSVDQWLKEKLDAAKVYNFIK